MKTVEEILEWCKIKHNHYAKELDNVSDLMKDALKQRDTELHKTLLTRQSRIKDMQDVVMELRKFIEA